MNRAWYLVPLLGGGWLFAYCGGTGRDGDMAGRMDLPDSKVQAAGSDVVGETHGGNSRTRSKIRDVHAKPTIKETTELFRKTIIPVFDLPEDQTVFEGVELLNRLIQQTGVEPHRLRIVISATDPGRHLRCRDDLGVMRNVPLEDVVHSLFGGATKMRYRVAENGVIEVLSQSIIADEPDSFAPSADPE